MQNNVIYHKLNQSELPSRLKDIDSPPKQLFYRGNGLESLHARPTATIVGSRRPTPYGIEVTNSIARTLSQAGVAIISGLALGIDSIAHKACLDVNGITIAVLPSGLDNIYPHSHKNLAEQIVSCGGSLVSEYPKGTSPQKQQFIARNRIVAALGDIVIVTEAAEQSGTLHTANFALNQGKTVMAVPGPITSPLSKGTNNLIKAGALPLTSPEDALIELGVSNMPTQKITASSPEEFIILTLIQQGISEGNQLLRASKLSPSVFNQTITLLEINGRITSLGANHWQVL